MSCDWFEKRDSTTRDNWQELIAVSHPGARFKSSRRNMPGTCSVVVVAAPSSCRLAAASPAAAGELLPISGGGGGGDEDMSPPRPLRNPSCETFRSSVSLDGINITR